MSDNQGATSSLFQGYTVYCTLPNDQGAGYHKGEFLRSSYVLVEEWFYSANIGGVIDDSCLKANRVIVIYLKKNSFVVKTLFIVC